MNKNLKHPPYNKFKGFLKENEIKYKDIASYLGITTSTLSQKINGKSDFLLGEIKLIKNKFNVTDEFFL